MRQAKSYRRRTPPKGSRRATGSTRRAETVAAPTSARSQARPHIVCVIMKNKNFSTRRYGCADTWSRSSPRRSIRSEDFDGVVARSVEEQARLGGLPVCLVLVSPPHKKPPARLPRARRFSVGGRFLGSTPGRTGNDEIRKVLPSGEFPLRDLPLDHPIFHVLLRREANCRRSRRSTSGWARAAARRSAAPTAPCRTRAPSPDAQGHMLCLHDAQHRLRRCASNAKATTTATSISSAAAGYAVGVDVLLCALTHRRHPTCRIGLQRFGADQRESRRW